MAKELTGVLGTYYAGGSITEEQKKANALYICRYLTTKADPQWTLNAIAGLCGNIESECNFDPGLNEAGPGTGFGLIQWTPGKNHKDWWAEHRNDYPEFSEVDYKSIDAQLAHIAYEAKNGVSWMQGAGWGNIDYEAKVPKYQDFAVSVLDPYFLACAYAWCRERSGVVQWGFHTKNHGNEGVYCMPGYSKPNKGCYACYAKAYGESAAIARAEINRQELRDQRGGQANKWYEYLVEVTFDARLDETDTSVYKLPYYVSRQNGRGGLNYNTAIEDWPNAQAGWSAADRAAIIGTGTVLPNCTSWAWGRAYEIMGKEPMTFSGDAGNWWNYFESNKDYFEKAGYIQNTTTPALGAIACWRQSKTTCSSCRKTFTFKLEDFTPNDPEWPTRSGKVTCPYCKTKLKNVASPYSMGHVAIVEAIDKTSGTISFSESGYTTWSWGPSYFNVKANVKPTEVYTNYEFMGYIQLPTIRSLLPNIESFKNLSVETETAKFEVVIKANGNALDNVYYKLSSGEISKLTVADGKKTFDVPNLVPNTPYSIRVVIEVGERFVESQELTFTTKQDYPDPVKDISISASKHNENSSFKVKVTAPGRWGYWQRIGNSYGYRVYIIDNGKLASYEDKNANNDFNITPHIGHEHNFQIGISSWVTDHRIVDKEKQKIFALEGHPEFPVGSNSICLKEPSEVSEYCYLITKDSLLSGHKINRLQPYYIKGIDLKPLKIFKPADFK